MTTGLLLIVAYGVTCEVDLFSAGLPLAILPGQPLEDGNLDFNNHAPAVRAHANRQLPIGGKPEKLSFSILILG
jgi:hypothetical protein